MAQLEREKKDRESERSSINVFLPQIATKTRAGPGQNQEPGVSSWVPRVDAGAQAFEISSAAFPRTLERNT